MKTCISHRGWFALIMIGLLVAACGGGGDFGSVAGMSTADEAVADTPTTQCDATTLTCFDGTVVPRDPNNNCSFCSCPVPGIQSPPCVAEAVSSVTRQ
jgi:hypothetical protein